MTRRERRGPRWNSWLQTLVFFAVVAVLAVVLYASVVVQGSQSPQGDSAATPSSAGQLTPLPILRGTARSTVTPWTGTPSSFLPPPNTPYPAASVPLAPRLVTPAGIYPDPTQMDDGP